MVDGRESLRSEPSSQSASTDPQVAVGHLGSSAPTPPDIDKGWDLFQSADGIDDHPIGQHETSAASSYLPLAKAATEPSLPVCHLTEDDLDLEDFL